MLYLNQPIHCHLQRVHLMSKATASGTSWTAMNSHAEILTIENKPVTISGNSSKPPKPELNNCYALFEAHNIAHTESAPTAAAEEASPISLSVADVTRAFKRVNIRKAVGPDGIPGRVLRACAFQLAGFLQTPSTFPSLFLWLLHASKNPPLCPYQRKIKVI